MRPSELSGVLVRSVPLSALLSHSPRNCQVSALTEPLKLTDLLFEGEAAAYDS